MLKLIEISAATKTRGIATTYRAGAGDQFGTCPKTCELNPSGGGSTEIDQPYFDALLSAVPKNGAAFTYCHFDYVDWSNKALPLSPRKTVVNYSAPSLYAAAESMRDGVAACVVVAPEYWQGGNSNNYGETDSDKLTRFAASLRTGSVLRHHVAGDMGKQPTG